MEFISSREEFFSAVSSVEGIVKSKLGFAPQLSNVLLEAYDGVVSIKASNGDMGQVTKIDSTVKQEGAISIPHTRLMNVLRQTTSGDLLFSTNKENVLSIKPVKSNRKFEIKILGIPSDDFAELPAFPSDEPSIILDKGYFKKMIQKVLFATSAEPTRYAIHGVLLTIKNQKINLVATDTRKLALFETTLPDLGSTDENLILSQELLSHLQKLCLNEGPVSLIFHENRIFIKFDQYLINSGLVNGEFPPYEMLIPKKSPSYFNCNREEIVKAIELSASIYEMSKLTKTIWHLSDKGLRILSKEQDHNQAQETIEIDYQGEAEITVGFNVRMILDILKQIETEKVDFHFSQANGPFVVKEHGMQESTFVIMPIVLSS